MKSLLFVALSISLAAVGSLSYGANQRVRAGLAGQCDGDSAAQFSKEFKGIGPDNCAEVCLYNGDLNGKERQERCWVAPTDEAYRAKDLINAMGAAMGSEKTSRALLEAARKSNSTRDLTENLKSLSGDACSGTVNAMENARRELKKAEDNQRLVYQSMKCPAAKDGGGGTATK